MTALKPTMLPKSFKLPTNDIIPSIGFGLYKIDRSKAAEAVNSALDCGYKHFDGAFAYNNEDIVGDVLQKRNIDRKNIWLTGKNWNSCWNPSLVKGSCEKTLNDLKTSYLDLYLLHWPVAFKNSKLMLDKMPEKRQDTQFPVLDLEAMENLATTWEAMENLVKDGKVKNIGISNFSNGKTLKLLEFAKIKPVVNQVEINRFCSQPDLVNKMNELNILTQCYSPLGSDPKVDIHLKDELLVKLSQKINVQPSQLILGWLLKRGLNPLPRSINPEHIKSNLQAADISIPQDIFDELDKEAAKSPNTRVIDPSKSWEYDIFSD